MNAAKLLLIEDDAELGEELAARLRREGCTLTWVRDSDEALALDAASFDLVLLDLGLPGTYGLDVLVRYRAASDVPVVILTADKVRGLSLGADDYVTKPFWPDELLARVRARLRRPAMRREDAETVRAGALSIDLAGRRATVGSHAIDLTPSEMAILAILARRAGRTVTRASLVEEGLDGGRGGTERALDVHVSRLRKKLGDEGARIATVWGIGYRLEVDR